MDERIGRGIILDRNFFPFGIEECDDRIHSQAEVPRFYLELVTPVFWRIKFVNVDSPQVVATMLLDFGIYDHGRFHLHRPRRIAGGCIGDRNFA